MNVIVDTLFPFNVHPTSSNAYNYDFVASSQQLPYHLLLQKVINDKTAYKYWHYILKIFDDIKQTYILNYCGQQR